MKVSRSIACIILSIMMVISMMPANSLAVFAEGETPAAQERMTNDTAAEGDASGETEEITEDEADSEEVIDEPSAEGTEETAGSSEENQESTETAEPVETEEEPAPEAAEEKPEGGEAVDVTEDEEEEAEPEEEGESTAGYASKDGVEGIDVSGPAASDEEKAAEALADMTSLSEKKAEKRAAKLFAATDEDAEAVTEEAAKAAEKEGEAYPSHADGSSIDVMTAQWITPDSVNNGDDALLYVRSNGSSNQQVRLRINYALSGEHSYSPYDITISFPAHIFNTRDGKPTGSIIVPYPEDPSKKQDFNWKQVGDKIVVTNTKKMSAATKGYIEIAFDGLDPALIKDMGLSDEFIATIEVTTFKDNILSLSADPLTAQFDTEARLTDVNKRNISVTRVKAAQIPENQRVEGEESYIKVDWYVWGATNSNTYYTIDQLDSIPQASAVQTKKVVEDGAVKDPSKEISVTDAQAYKEGAAVGDTVTTMTEADVKGFVLGAGSSDDAQLEKKGVYYGRNSGRGSDYSFSTVYPASQFEKDTEYTFHNTIKYTVTEKDEEVTEHTNPNVQDVDPQLVTTQTASAQVKWSYTDPKWINPGGHYMVHKNGNDDNYPESANTTHRSSYSYSDLHRNDDGYYGIYPSAINDLQKAHEKDGEDGSVRLSYTINTIGYTLPWMYDGGVAEFEEGVIPARIIGNYNRPITMTTTDTGVSFGRNGAKLTVGTDYTFEEIEFPGEPYVYKGYPQNINADGTWEALDAGDGTFKYIRDTTKSNWPDIKLQIQIDGEWQDWATVSWKTGKRAIKLESGETLLNSGVVKVPKETQNFRTIVTTQNTAGGPGATEALQAGIQYDVRPVINLKSTDSLIARFKAMFEQSNTPSMAVYNSTNLLIEREDVSVRDAERVIHSIDRDGYDSIRGYTTDTSVYPYKTATQKLNEVDYENRVILIHYSARVEERSVIGDKKTWQEAVDEGNLQSEEICTWYDLLPKGVTPKIGTIKLRSGDSLVSADTFENYDGSGRTLLVVKAKLKPVPETYRSGDMTYYMDVPKISFDATYDFESWKDYGSNIHNVIAFESGNDSLGTVPKYTGEPDDPTSKNNVSTPAACVDNVERKAMTDLNGDGISGEGAPNTFVYAGVTTRVDLLAAARTSLYKDVEVNNDNIWNEGTYYTSKEEAKEATEGGNKRTVFEGGQYTYRLRVMSDPDTISAGMIIYDALEDFEAKASDDEQEADNDEIDIAAVRAGAVWKGTLREVDVSQLKELGCDPVVYYSTKIRNYNSDDDAEYALTLGVKDDTPNETNIDVTNTNVWTKAKDYTGSMSDVTAIAIDCTKDTKGNIFTLNPLESAVVLVRMKAPSGERARELMDDDMIGVWGDSAQAYNNAFLYAASFKEDDYSGEVTDDDMDFIRKDYTKVGLKEYSITADKAWNDDNNRDGKRPKTIELELYANGKPMQPARKQTLNVAEGKSVTFEHIPYTDDDGEKIHYTIVEKDVDGYTAEYTVDQQDAQLFHVLNTHEPERTQVSGEKTWTGDEEYQSARPSSIDVELYGNGKKLKTQTVKVDEDGKWSYEFINLYKYENGKEITYTVKEVKTPGTGNKADSYVPEYNDDNIDIKNTYHPFGEIFVSKTIEDTTKVSAENEFTFTFTFTKTEGSKEIPVFDEFEYEILDEEGEPVTDESGEPLKGKVGTNGTVSIKGGQKIHVFEIPEMLSYKVTEEAKDGFTLVEKSGDSGQIDPNKATQVSFTNKYSASGLINLEAIKKLEDRKISKNQFLFELYEVTTDEDGKEVEIPKPSATNDAASEVDEEDGRVASSAAPVIFGGIRYTQNDHGKTFTYRIKEVDRGKAGYTYSKDVFEAKVTVTDNGDGTLKITPVYTDKDGNEVEKPVFTNKYEAKGSTKLQAWKDLPGRELTDGEFEFELLNEKGEPIVNSKSSDADSGDDADAEGGEDADAGDADSEGSGGTAVTATNKADGTVTFDPAEVEALNYTQEDIGKTFYYAIREKAGDDDSVTYDKAVYGYEVKIIDNGDGMLYAEQSLATPEFDKDDPTKIVGWTTEGAVLPVFNNKLEPGSLSIQKLVDQPTEGDPSTPFKFKVKLIGEDIPEGEKEYTITQAAEVSDNNSASSNSKSSSNDSAADTTNAKAAAKTASGVEPSTAKEAYSMDKETAPKVKAAPLRAADDIVPQQTAGGWGIDWRITEDGELILGNGGEQVLDAVNYTYRADASTGPYPRATEIYLPWEYNKSRIKSISISGKIVAKGDLYCFFDALPNCQKIDLTGLDISNVTHMQYLFFNDPALKAVDFGDMDTSRIQSMANMFLYTEGIKEVTLSPNFKFKNSVKLPTPVGSNYTGKWIRDDEAYGPYTPAELASNYTAQMAGTWVWEEKNTEYTIKFTADSPVAGSMDSISVREAASGTLPANKFVKHGAEFDHWVVVEKNGTAVEDGAEYADKATVAGKTYSRGDVITLKAVFTPKDLKVNIEEGEFEIELFAVERATFDGIPAGTSYQVYEETPAGWILVETVNASGVIEATKESVASFKNEYAPGSASAQFYGTKTLDGRAAAAGAFTFELKDSSGNVLQTKSTTDGGFIQFDPIKYTEAGTYKYTITEVAPSGDTIDYDTHSETVTVKVEADGDELTAEVSYDDDGIRFANTTKPGNLKLTKKTDIKTDANKDDEFTFRIRFNNANGQPIGKESKIYWFTEPAEATEDAKVNNKDSGTAKQSLRSKVSSLLSTGKATQEAEITQGTNIEDIDTGKSLNAAGDAPILRAPGDIAAGTFRGADWRITSDGTLIIGNGDTQTLNGNGNKDNPGGWPWYSYRSRIKAVKFDGTVKMTGSAAGMFKGEANLVTFDSTGFDPSGANNFCHMFYGDSKLKSVDAKGWVTSKVANIDGMFMNCYAIQKVDTGEWDVSSVVTIYQLFENCNNLEEVDTTSWKTYKTNAFHWMNDIFSDCHKLKDVDTSGWVIQDTIEGWQWFNNDYKIRRLDLTGVTRPTNAQYQTNCFTNMNSLSIFKVGTRTFDNNVARFQPGTWKNVATGVTYDGNWLNRNWKSNMAGTYVRLTATFYKNGEMIIDWGYDESRNSEVDDVYILSDNTGSTPPWDSYAGKSKVTKVTINTDISPASTAKWFNGMSSLKKIEGLDNLKMTNLTNMQNMFTGCTSLDSINLPDNFSFKGKNISSTSQQALLPTPPSTDGFIGEWVRDDEGYGPFTPAELRDQFNTQMAGTWVWAVDSSVAMVTYYGTGGFPEMTRYKTTDPTESITTPDNKTVTRPHYILTGWNTKEDGSGTSYDPGETLDGFLQLGKHKVLYAQWETTDLCSYKVEHYQQKADGSGYNLVDTDRPDLVVAGTKVTPEVKSYPGFLSPEPQTAEVLDDSSLVVKYYYDKLVYKVHFDGNGATSGAMEDQTVNGGAQIPLSANQFKREGYLFTGWTTEADGSGKYYIDQQKVRDLTKTDGATVTLYAKWLSKDDAELEPTNGEIIVKCKAGETIVIPDLPAGTTYTIEEIGSPDGWTQSGEIEGNNDAIAANTTKYATVNNTYTAEGEVQIVAHKRLVGGTAEPGQFTFELYKDAELTDLVETKTNGELDTNEQATGGQSGSNPYYQTAEVEFTPIELTKDHIGKTLTYYVREAGKDEAEAEGITIDETVYKVDISVTDAGSGLLTANVTYTDVSSGSAVSGEPIFVNTMKPASLKISKNIVGATDSVADTEFTFTVELKDADGNALDGEYDVKIGDAESKIRSGGTLDLKGGEEAVISGLPHGASYAVTEKARKHWDQTGKTGDSGLLRPGKTAEAEFTNTYVPPAKYESEGTVKFKAVKEVEGGALTAEDGFTFELTDERGNVLQTKGPDKVSSDEGVVYSSDISFDAIEYTIDDLPYPSDAVNAYVDGKLRESYDAKDDLYDAAKAIFDADKGNKDKEFTYEAFFTIMHQNKMKSYLDELTSEAEASAVREADFIYYVKEVAGDDPDVTYDKQQYYFKVHAVDNGKGVIETSVTKWQPGVKTDPDTGEVIIDEETGQPVIEDKEIDGDEITFTNKKSTQIKVTKRWADSGDVDGYRPSVAEFKNKIHLMNGETEVTGYEPEITDDGKDSWAIVYTGLPAYDNDGNKISYTVKEDEITNYKAKDDKTVAENGETLLNVHEPDTVDLRLTKKIDSYLDFGEDTNVSFGFSIVAYDKKAYEAGTKTKVWETFTSMTYENGDGPEKTNVISNVPKEAVIEVTEVYAGNYRAKDDIYTLTAEYDEDEGIWTVSFENVHKDGDNGEGHPSSGIVNRYVDNKYDSPK